MSAPKYTYDTERHMWTDGTLAVSASVALGEDVIWLGVYSNRAEARRCAPVEPCDKAAYFDLELNDVGWLKPELLTEDES